MLAMKLRILTAQDINQALSMAQAVEAMKAAYRELSLGRAVMPLRSRLPVERAGGVTLLMPALVEPSGDMAVKLVSVFPGNPALGLPTIHAVVVVFDAQTGQPVALLEGGALTALRTGAGSGAATDILARADARSVAIFGSGVQARTQLLAVCAVRSIERAMIYSPDSAHAERLAGELAGTNAVTARIELAASPEAALDGADIVCTATSSHTPVFPGRALARGTHINAVGSYTPEMQEVDETTLQRARVYVDSRSAALEEAGDLLVPIEQGKWSVESMIGEIGQVLAGDVKGRTSPDDITYFKSVGVAVQDAVAAGRALKAAEAAGLGQVVEL